MATLPAEYSKDIPADVNVVDAIPAPGGGWWALGDDGGVFAVGGAPYLGSYPGLDPAERLGTRSFAQITPDPGGYGYTLVSNVPGQTYTFGGQPPPTSSPPTSSTVPTAIEQRRKSTEATSARALIVSILADYNLPASLVTTLWDQWYVKESRPTTQIFMDLRQTKEFKARFPGIAALETRRNKGEAVDVPTPEEYLALETGIASVMRDAGLPPGFYDDPTDFAEFIGGSSSPKEIEDRIEGARRAMFSLPVQTRQEMSRLYDVDEGELVAYFLDPDRALPLIERRVATAGIGGAAKRTGFGLLTRAEAEALQAGGLAPDQAGQGFAAIGQLAPLFAETLAEERSGEDIGRSEQLGFVAGEAGAATEIERRRRRRAATFSGGGGASSGGEGGTGLGTAR